MRVIERKDNVYRLEQHGRKFFAARMQQGLTAMIVVAHADGTPADAQTRAEAESAVEDWSATQAHDALCVTLLASAKKAFGS